MSNFVVKKSIDIVATPAEVWDALTNPAKTKKYFFHCEVFSDWKKGSTITFKGKMFFIIPIEMTGKILRAVPEKILQYTLKNGKHEDASSFSTVTDELYYNDVITTLSITDDVGTGIGADKRYKRSMKGWDKVLRGLKKFVEKEL